MSDAPSTTGSKSRSLWYTFQGSVIQGPYSEAELARLVRTGMLTRETQLTRDRKVFIAAGDCFHPSFFVQAVKAPRSPLPAHALDLELEAEAEGNGNSNGDAETRSDLDHTPPPLVPVTPGVKVSVNLPPSVEERYRPSRPVSAVAEDVCMCPHCWTLFPLEDVLFIAHHPDLLGDIRLGSDAPQRFKASRFTPDGQAIDPGGMISPEMACPMCHLQIPRGMIEMRPEFFSIVGAPATGKSFYLATLTWELRQTMARDFGFSFTDTDSTMNRALLQNEDKLFLNAEPNAFVGLEKTKLAVGELYSAVNFAGQATMLPRPFIFSLNAQPHNPVFANASRNARSIVLYDNAGEHFEPGEETVLRPCGHLVHSRCLFFLMDPTKDPRFRALVHSNDPQIRNDARSARQDVLLNEAGRRIRRDLGLPLNKKIPKQLIVIVTKYDVWKDLLRVPVRPTPILKSTKAVVSGLDAGHIEDVSFSLRDLLHRVCPEFVAAAEEFSDDVTFIPVSALGHSPSECDDPLQPGRTALLVRPADIQPFWATVPFLYALARAGYLCFGSSKPESVESVQAVSSVRGFLICEFRDGSTLNVPERFAGKIIHHPATGQPFQISKRAPPVHD